MYPKIDDYRGFEIYFNTNSEMFTATGLESKSHAGLKLKIDETIKSTQTFEPFEIELLPNIWTGTKREKMKVISIRKDGAFTIERNGKNVMLSTYDERDYMIYNPKNEQSLKELAILNKKATAMNDKIKKFIKNNFVVEKLGSFREKILSNHLEEKFL